MTKNILPVLIEIETETRSAEDLARTTDYSAKVSQGTAGPFEFDFNASRKFMDTSEEEILEQIIRCDEDAWALIRGAVEDGSKVFLNGFEMSTDVILRMQPSNSLGCR